MNLLTVALFISIVLTILCVLLIAVIAIVYYAAPNLKQQFRVASAGSVLAVAVWIAMSVAFAFYVQNFGNYNATYGSMGAVIVLLLYFFLSAAVLLFGAEVNAVVSRERGETLEEADDGSAG